MKLVLKKKPSPTGSSCPRPEPGLYKLWGTVGTVLTVDPGLGGTGWAVWSRENFDDLVRPVSSGSIEASHHRASGNPYQWYERASIIADELLGIKQRWNSAIVYVEQPAFMESAGKGLSAARDGDLVTLSALFGIIAGRLTDARSSLFCPVLIHAWKGSMDKDITKIRVLEKLPGWKPATGTTHEIDAVGIGLHVKGHL